MFVTNDPEENTLGFRLLSSSPTTPPPTIAGPLLEMGFSFGHIVKAMSETRIIGESNAEAMSILATWMLEHPYCEREEMEQTVAGSGSRFSFRTLLERTERTRDMPRPQSLDGSDIECVQRRLIGELIFFSTLQRVVHVHSIQKLLGNRSHIYLTCITGFQIKPVARWAESKIVLYHMF